MQNVMFQEVVTVLKILLILLGLVTSSLALAGDWASIAITPGYGRIEIVSNYIIFSSGKSYDAKIPKRITAVPLTETKKA